MPIDKQKQPFQKFLSFASNHELERYSFMYIKMQVMKSGDIKTSITSIGQTILSRKKRYMIKIGVLLLVLSGENI